VPERRGIWKDGRMSEPAREVLTWQTFGTASRELARLVVDSGFQPDLIMSITRGGMLPAGAMSYAMGIKNLHIINVEFYTGVDTRLPLPVLLPPVPVAVDLSAKKVLIVDDVADTGETLRMVRDFCAEHVAETRTAVLYEKSHSVVTCDYVWKRTDEWIAFPWSSEEPLVGISTDN
jgi:hypoxanthine phosphoribosyltransferase